MKFRVIFLLVAVLILHCGKQYIKPDPKYSYPEMEQSLIADSLGVYFSGDNLSFKIDFDNNNECCRHKSVLLGEGLQRAVGKSVEAVFRQSAMLPQRANDTVIKAMDLRGLLHVKKISGAIEFAANIDSGDNRNSGEEYTIIMTVIVNFSAIDFRLSDIREFSLEQEVAAAIPVTARNVNDELEDLSNQTLEKLADALARELIKIYGARA